MSANSAAPVTRLAVLLFTDIVGSTELKSKLGTTEYAKLLARHNALFEDAMRACPAGQIIKHTGDGYFATLPTASDAVRFALQLQTQMKREPWGPTSLNTRVGIHIGEVQLLDMAGRADVVGFSADIAARLMSLALGGQILLTEGAFNDARQFVSRAPDAIGDGQTLRWIAHGAYLFKGSDDPLDVFEVGIDGLSPLSRPDHSDKVKRVVPHDQEATLGWRPAVGLEIPSRVGWTLERKIGEGGFGEVWLARHHRTKDCHIFKFCFDVDRLRSFKRELTLFRLIREALGDRPDIAKLYEVKLDEPPFFLEGEYSAGGNLLEWSDQFGGINKLPLVERLELIAKIADAVAAAHSVGILHKDIKPSNILIHEEPRDAPDAASGQHRPPTAPVQPRLCDFGIGILADRTQLQARAITATGFTQLTQNESSRTGTRIYAPPESLLNRPFTTQGDVYALGVMTYQMAVGDLHRPLAPGWERDVADELLREDIAAMVEGDPARRMASASEVARRLRSLDARRQQRAIERLAITRAKRRRRQLQWMAAATVALTLLSAAFAISLVRERHLRAQIAEQKDRAEQQSAIAKAVSQFQSTMLASADPDKLLGDRVTVVDAARAAASDLDAGTLSDQPLVEAGVRSTIGLTFLALGRYDDARPNLQRALALRRQTLPPNHSDIAESLSNLADLFEAEGKLPDAEALDREALAIYRQVLPAGRSEIAATVNNLAVVLQQEGKFAEAEPLLREAVASSRAALPAGHRDIATSLDSLAQYMQAQGKLDEAGAIFREALAINRKALPDGHRAIALSLNNLANLLAAQGKLDEALPLCRESLAICRKTLPPGHRESAEAMTNLAGMLQALGKRDEAEPLYREAVDSMRKSLGVDHPRLAKVLNNFAMFLFDGGNARDAEPLLREAMAIDRKSLAPAHPDLAAIHSNLVRVLQTLGQTARADELLREVLQINRAAFPAAHPTIAKSLIALGASLQAQGKPLDAEPLFAEALAINRKSLPAGHADIASALSALGRTLLALGRLDQAEPLLREAVTIRRDKFGANASSTKLTATALAELLDHTNRAAEATALRRECGLLAPSSRPN